MVGYKGRKQEFNSLGGNMKLVILKVTNGYVVKGNDPVSRESTSHVIEESAKDELLSGESLLWYVMEYFRFSGTKHDKERLRIVRMGNTDYQRKWLRLTEDCGFSGCRRNTKKVSDNYCRKHGKGLREGGKSDVHETG